MKHNIEKPEGKLGILLPGMGAVATTLISGVLATRKGIGQPIGSLTQMGTIRLGKRTENRNPLIKDFVPLADLNDIVFGGWDLFTDNAYESALKAGVLDKHLVEELKDELIKIKPMKAVFDKKYIVNLTPNNLKPAATRYEYAQELIKDIEMFKEENNCSRLVMIWCGSTEVYSKASIVHQTIESLEDGLKNDNQAIPPSMIYAYAALKSGVPFANGSPNLTCDVPAMVALAQILKDTSSVMLIKKSIDYIYNYQFKDAEQACSEISILFPGHPVEYLLKGMITYWENFPLLTNSPARVLFEKDLRTCIEICEKIPDSIDEPEYLLTNLCAR